MKLRWWQREEHHKDSLKAVEDAVEQGRLLRTELAKLAETMRTNERRRHT